MSDNKLYDADAEQRMAFQTERKGRLYTVTHIFGPIVDEAVLEYERGRSQRIGEAENNESDEGDATAISSKGFAAAVNYWNSAGTRAEGYAGVISDRDKAFAVQNMLFLADFDQLPLANADEVCPEDNDESSTYIMRSLFAGAEVQTSATLRPATPEEISDFEALMSRTLLVKGTRFGQRDQRIPSKAKRLAELFDLMKVAVDGYIRVPLHHKMLFALRHLRGEQKAITGK
jgi:hypothetical protein